MGRGAVTLISDDCLWLNTPELGRPELHELKGVNLSREAAPVWDQQLEQKAAVLFPAISMFMSHSMQ